MQYSVCYPWPRLGPISDTAISYLFPVLWITGRLITLTAANALVSCKHCLGIIYCSSRPRQLSVFDAAVGDKLASRQKNMIIVVYNGSKLCTPGAKSAAYDCLVTTCIFP